MQFVTLTQNVAPWQANERVCVPDEAARILISNGEARDPEPFPATAPALVQTVMEPEPAKRGPGRPPKYLTKG